MTTATHEHRDGLSSFPEVIDSISVPELLYLRPIRADMTSDGLEPGHSAIPFDLPNANSSVGGEQVSFESVAGEKGTIVLFTCNHCPYVVASMERIANLAEQATGLGIGFVAISSNDGINYPEDRWERMQQIASKDGYTWPYLHDESQAVAAAWGAERTPEVYLLNSNNVVVYRGRIDDSPRDPRNVTTSDLSDAIDQLVNDEQITTPRTQSIGCSVKWKM